MAEEYVRPADAAYTENLSTNMGAPTYDDLMSRYLDLGMTPDEANRMALSDINDFNTRHKNEKNDAKVAALLEQNRIEEQKRAKESEERQAKAKMEEERKIEEKEKILRPLLQIFKLPGKPLLDSQEKIIEFSKNNQTHIVLKEEEINKIQKILEKTKRITNEEKEKIMEFFDIEQDEKQDSDYEYDSDSYGGRRKYSKSKSKKNCKKRKTKKNKNTKRKTKKRF